MATTNVSYHKLGRNRFYQHSSGTVHWLKCQIILHENDPVPFEYQPIKGITPGGITKLSIITCLVTRFPM